MHQAPLVAPLAEVACRINQTQYAKCNRYIVAHDARFDHIPPSVIHAVVRSVVCVQVASDLPTIGDLCTYLSRDDHAVDFSLRNAVLPLTSNWPVAAAEVVSTLLITPMARQWLPEVIASIPRHVASFPRSAAPISIADASLRLDINGCILVPEASCIKLCNMTIQGAAYNPVALLAQQAAGIASHVPFCTCTSTLGYRQWTSKNTYEFSGGLLPRMSPNKQKCDWTDTTSTLRRGHQFLHSRTQCSNCKAHVTGDQVSGDQVSTTRVAAWSIC